MALDFYFKYHGVPPSKTSVEVAQLSEKIRSLSNVEHMDDSFRNPNGCYMKLMNFRNFDSRFGSGFGNTSRADRVVWEMYAHDQNALSAAVIEMTMPQLSGVGEPKPAYLEGGVAERFHKYRERNAKAVAEKKAQTLAEKGHLKCEACNFDYTEAYGERGDGFIECHHETPISASDFAREIKLSDLVLLCANCHRMVHRKKPWLSLVDLKSLVKNER